MENLFLTTKEHEVLKKFKNRIEKWYGVGILMPQVDRSSTQSDVIFATLCGTEDGIKNVKDFIIQSSNKSLIERSQRKEKNEDPELITISDSDDESTDNVFEPVVSEQNSEQSAQNANDSVYVLDTSFSLKSCPEPKDLDESVVIIEEKVTNHRKTKKKKMEQDIVSTSFGNLEKVKKRPWVNKNETKTPEFIPLFNNSASDKDPSKKRKICTDASKHTEKNDDVMILKDCDTQGPLQGPRLLRPIVIDANNVAREHGGPTNTFSSKGIQLAIEFFLQRGHTEVCAFIPRIRMNYTGTKCPTTDQPILEDLYRKKYLCLTPHRSLNGKKIISYDDRFAVQHASRIGGVIVSNDNYRDLINENEVFKETIENRLMTYSFARDHFMPSYDPLGRYGPFIDEFLSFPVEKVD